MTILDLIASDNFIPYNKAIAKKIGVAETIVFGAFCGYQRINKGNEFYREQDKIVDDTSLTRYEVRNAIKKLNELGIINITRKGLPSKFFYTINSQKVVELLDLSSSIKFDTTSDIKINTTSDNENNTTIKKNNNKKINKENSINTIKEKIREFGFTDKLCNAIETWWNYKKEKGQTYKEVGFNTLLKRLKQDWLSLGEEKVIKGIENSIANNYSGIFYDKSNKLNGKQFEEQREYSQEYFDSLITKAPKTKI